MRPFNTPLTFSVLGFILSSIASINPSLHQASAAPIPPPLTRQPANTFNNTYFPYTVTGPAPPPLYTSGSILDSCTAPNSYAISFDDGPGQLTDELLDYLDEQQLKVTFFMNGENWDCIYRPESQRLLKRAYQAQHQIAAHPWSHRDLDSLSDHDIRDEMYKIENAFRQILGVVPRYMRPPYGEASERVRKVLRGLGYILILWDVDQLNKKNPIGDETQKPMTSGHQQASFSSKWAEAVRGVPHSALDRESMMVGGIYQEATSVWAVEYVQNLGYDVMPVGQCLGEADPRLWYKEIGMPETEEDLPQSCYF
ncbi:Carbohydrate esterase 4 protein [Podila minutissima]|uniref:Carbohydrate esterase 4 protein n=1 Tax=Podila minutissima TaxID=64525 RepID=A0A9P5STB5_9FUNG|nr:Carbohydrate esterase 4 protein [Podila minutissima]